MFELFESLIGGPKDEFAHKTEILGTYNFYLEPKFQGFVGLHTSTIVLSAFQDNSKRYPVEISVKWAKIMGNEKFDMEGYEEKYYNMTPSDIDLKIRAAVTSNDPRFHGVAYLYVGPIEMDKSLIPEIESLIMQQSGQFKANLLNVGGLEIIPNNVTKIKVEKPYLTLNFDQKLSQIEEYRTLANSGALDPIEIDFESDKSLKIRVDNRSITDVVISYKNSQEEDKKLKVRFANRLSRDVFYIFVRLMRSIKSSFFEKLMAEFNILKSAPWSILNIEREDDEDESPGEPGYEMILKYDLIRELLRSMIVMNRDLNAENSELLDSMFTLDTELQKTVAKFRELLKEAKSKSGDELKKLEKSNRSHLAETSMLLEDSKKRKDQKKGGEDPSPSASPQMDSASRLTSLKFELDDEKKKGSILRQRIDQIKLGFSPSKGSPGGEDSKSLNFGDISQVPVRNPINN